MLNKMTASLRSAKRIAQTSVAVNKLVLHWAMNRDTVQADMPILLRDTMQGLGVTYIKLGQLVASSPTLFPQEYVDAFQSCLDQTQALPYSEIEPILEAHLGSKIKTHFSYIDKKPLACASIAQVHAAVLISGEKVVLKIQKPGVKELLETDFNFLHLSTQLIDLMNPKAWKSSIIDIVQEIRNGMLEECDFRQEAENIEEFRLFLQQANIEHVVVPKVYSALSTDKVLVMEQFFGVPLSDLEGVRRICGDPEFALVQALDTWFLSLRQCQHYHADLHAGNVLVLEDGRIGFIDFGIVGRLSNSTWEGLTSLAVCIPNEDFSALALALSKIGATKERIDLNLFAQDLERFWQQMMSDNAPSGSDPDAFIRNITMTFSTISARHGIRFPREFTLLIKQFLYFDRYIRILAPDVNMFDMERMDMMDLAV